MTSSRLWDKGKPLDERILRYTAGEDHRLDERLVAYDIRASIAHARMLAARSLLSSADCESICDGLAALGAAHARGEWRISLEEEDCHSALERRLIERIGPAGGRVHLGRSRNDQVLAALRLYIKDAAASLADGARGVAAALDAIAERQGSLPLPGYTHMQAAMPSSVALWTGGFAAELRDDAAGIERASIRADSSPLGSAAGYGVPGLDLDREHTRQALGFAKVHEPVTAVQLSRGKAESSLIFELVLLLADLSRLASDLLLYYTREFAFVALPDAMTTGSSIMPQKRNPDVFELIRAAVAVPSGALAEAMSITSKLTSGYHRDLQRLKLPLFRSIDIAEETMAVMTHALGGIQFREQAIELDPELFAAERANVLVVEEGIPFREAYRRVAAELAKSRSDEDD